MRVEVASDLITLRWKTPLSRNAYPLQRVGLHFGADAVASTTYMPAETAWRTDGLAGTLSTGQQARHGTGTTDNAGGFTYTSTTTCGEPLRGWDFFGLRVTETDGVSHDQWVQMNVGYARVSVNSVSSGAMLGAIKRVMTAS